MYRPQLAAKLLFRLVLIGSFGCCLPLRAQELAPSRKPAALRFSVDAILPPSLLPQAGDYVHYRNNLMPEAVPGYMALRSRNFAESFDKTKWSTSPNTIDKMESAFYCNDTPFVDSVRLPLATFWNGRVKLVGFESDVTTANFVLGLPGQGSLHSLSAFGNAFIATHTPPSDQLAGIHMTISLRPTDTDAGENSGRRGIEYLVRASRGILPFMNARADSISMSTR